MALKFHTIFVPMLTIGAVGAGLVGWNPLLSGLAGENSANQQLAAIVGSTPVKQQPVAAQPASQIGKQQLVYTVKHSKYGKIGTYTNTIEHQGDMTNVTTNAKLAVSVLGVNMYRQDISRHETWKGDRIVDFHGVTTENGKTVEVNGKAEGDHFAVTTANGKTTAPADVRMANPWSREAVDGDMMLTPDRGKLEMVTMGSNEKTTLNIGNRQVSTEHIQVLRGGGAGRYDVWLDEKGTPVQFSVVGDDTVTFTLTG